MLCSQTDRRVGFWQVTVDLISNRDKSEMKDVVRDHLADNQGEAVPD